jgi:hypothetical protein
MDSQEVDPMDPIRLDVRTRPAAFLAAVAAILLTLVMSGAAEAASWSVQQRVATDPPSAMTVDDLGHTHIVIATGTEMRYVTDRTGRWVSTRISGQGGSVEPAIAIAAGKVYVVYAFIGDCDAERGCTTDPSMGLYLTTNRTGSWTTTRIPGTRPAYWPSLRMRDGKLHVSYQDRVGIRYLTDKSGAWVKTRVWSRTAKLTSSARTSIALDDAGRPHIAFMVTRGGVGAQGIRLASRVGGRWSVSNVSGGKDVLDRVVISADGWPVVGYTSWIGSTRRFRLCEIIDGDVFAYRTLPGAGRGSFTLDPSGRVELVRWADGRLTWWAERSTGWTHTSWSAPKVSVAWVRAFGGVEVVVRDGFASKARAFSTWVITRD